MRFTARTLMVGLVVAAAVLTMTTAASAAPPRIVTTEVNFSFPDSYLTQLCGVQVEFFHVGTLRSKLYFNREGAVTREIDTSQRDRFGWRSPTTGHSVQIPFATTMVTDYPTGAAVGSPATVTGSGLSLKVPGLPAEAGRAVFAGHVVAINADGVPIVAFDKLVSITGHSNDPDAVDAAICAALM